MRFKLFVQAFGFFVVFLLLSFIYLRHFGDVGKLPAESLEYSAKDSFIRSLEKGAGESGACHVIVERFRNTSTNSGGVIEILGPSIPLNKVDQELLDLVDASHVFLVQAGRLYAIDEVSVEAAQNNQKLQGSIQGSMITGYLSNPNTVDSVRRIKNDTSLVRNQLIEQNYVSRSSMKLLEEKTKEYYSRCPRLSKNEKLGVTEYFWGNEGRSVLHHWAHLYEGAIFGPVMKAQYGVVIPTIARLVSSIFPGDGPSQYISTAWILFYLSALIYSALLYLIFKKYPLIVTIALLIKIILFINLKEFIIFLAPGAHWFRELNFLIIYMVSNYYIFGDKKSKFCNIKLLFFAIFTLLFDPMSGFFGWSAVTLSYLLSNFTKNTIQITKKNVLIAVSFFAFLVVILFFYSSNAYYLFSMLVNNLFSNQLTASSQRFIIFNVLMLCVIALLYINNKVNYKYIYFSFLGNISIIYYLMTPDWVHYYKYLEYVILFYMCIFIISYNYFYLYLIKSAWFGEKIISRVNQGSIYFIKIMFLAALFVAISINFLKFNAINNSSPITVLYPQNNQIFFDSVESTINNKKIISNISSDLASHLSEFPLSDQKKYIVSNFDKYILFLYNQKNNFGYIDLRSQLVSDREADKILSVIKKNGGTFVVDENNFHINLGYGPKISGDPILIEANGTYFLGPYNYIKSQLRMAKISEYIFNKCIKEDRHSKNNWSTFNCPASTEKVSR
ncbi:MAG: hypothetical protein Q8R65_09240 [Polynucleobacter sp.]|nr:hypothetical protein [Polynucleobacter sp.]